jgi:hypothetical protein
MKTTEEIESLKRAWVADQCFDLGEVEGFEDHYPELRAFQMEYLKDAEEREDARLMIKREQWHKLKLNESFNINPDVDVIRVPGGWVMNQRFYEHMGGEDYVFKTVTSLFIPDRIGQLGR